MAVDNRSFGPLYFARYRVNRRRCPAHVSGIVETSKPWRRGKAFNFRTPWTKPSRVIAVGVWFRDRSKVSEAFEDDKWLSPHYLANVSIAEISTWDNGEEVDEAAPSDETELYGAKL